MGLISAIFSILTIIVGGVCIMLFVSTKTLRDSRDDQEKRIKFLEDERTRDKTMIASQATEIGILRRTVTGEDQLVAISALLGQHHKDAVTHWVQVTAGLGHVGTTLDSVNDSIDNLVTTLGGEA